MSKKVFVGNLPRSVDAEVLKAMFGEFGTVENVNVVTDRDTGQGKGYGFVQMSTDQEAAAATEALDGKEIEGRNLKVAPANPPKVKPRFGGGGGGGPRGRSGGPGGGGGRRPGGFGGRGGGDRRFGGGNREGGGGGSGGGGGYGRR